MAKENIAFLVNLRKNIVEGSKMEGRYYPEAESKPPRVSLSTWPTTAAWCLMSLCSWCWLPS